MNVDIAEIIESLNEGMFVLTHGKVVELWNDAMERITGIGRQHVLNRELFEAVPALLDTSISPAVAAALEEATATELQRVEFMAGVPTAFCTSGCCHSRGVSPGL